MAVTITSHHSAVVSEIGFFLLRFPNSLWVFLWLLSTIKPRLNALFFLPLSLWNGVLQFLRHQVCLFAFFIYPSKDHVSKQIQCLADSRWA